MNNDKNIDLTTQVLIEIRDEIKMLREDTNRGFEQIDGRFEQIDRRFEHIEGHLSDIRKNIKIIAERFDCDYLILGNGVEGIKKRLILWEEKLNLPHPGE